MDNKSNLINSEDYIVNLKEVLDDLDLSQIDNAIDLIEKVWRSGGQIITLGNGGSAMTALHMITDWNKSIYLSSGIQFKGRTLIDNMGLISAYGNDISFEDIFIEQLKNILQPKDLVIAISGSGNSENVIRAVDYANKNNAFTLGLCGFNGGKLKTIAQQIVWVNKNDMQLCEDIHAIFGHIVMKRLCNKNLK